MPIHRVIIVDSEVLVRQGLSARLNKTAEIEVAGVSSSFEHAFAKLQIQLPDALVLDFDPHDVESVKFLQKIRLNYPGLLIVSVVPTEFYGRKIPQDLIVPGRSELIVRPHQGTTAEAFLDEFSAQIRRKLTTMFQAYDLNRQSVSNYSAEPLSRLPIAPESKTTLIGSSIFSSDSIARESKTTIRTTEQETTEVIIRPSSRSTKRVDVIAIASSTGGPHALTELLPALTAGLPVPIVIVQHMPAEFTRSLADRLNTISEITVREAVTGEPLKAGLALLAPGDKHMVVERSIDQNMLVTLNQGPPENSCRPAADILFRSVAKCYGENVLAIVLTGMGKDGLAGSRVIRAAGGRVVAQDEASSVVWGMPGEVVHAKLADSVLPLKEIASEIIRRVRFGRTS
jgi:two-component system chemotaxis response regulator CheB